MFVSRSTYRFLQFVAMALFWMAVLKGTWDGGWRCLPAPIFMCVVTVGVWKRIDDFPGKPQWLWVLVTVVFLVATFWYLAWCNPTSPR